MRIPIQKVLAIGLTKSLEIVSINAYVSGVFFLDSPLDLFDNQRKELIMKSQMHTRASGSSSGGRSTLNGSLPYMSERQTQAYLMARDAIRRIQRTSSIFDPILGDPAQRLRTANRRQNSH